MERQLEGLDSAFLSLETSAAHMHMTALVTLAPREPGASPSYVDIRRYLEPRLRALPAFRRHISLVPLDLDHPVWAERDFDLDSHLHRVRVPSPGSMNELNDLVGHLAGLPLDRDRPLWGMWIIEGLEDDRTALLTKVHHALMDGVAGAEIFGRLFDTDPDAAWGLDRSADRLEADRPHSSAEILVSTVRSLARLPFRVAKQSLSSAAAVVRGLGAAVADDEHGPVATPTLAAPDTTINGAITARREVAVCNMPLEALKGLSRAFNVTINDVVLAACTGALRRHLLDNDEALDKPLIAAVPVSVASGASTGTSGNHVSAMTVSLPVQLADPVARLANIHRSSLRAKRAHHAVGGELLANLAELTPPALLSGVSALYSRLDAADWHRPLVNLIVSNVPGPREELFCAGHRIESCYPMGPIYEGCALNITVLSFAGRMHFGLLACPDVVTGLPRMAEAIDDAIRELQQSANVEQRLRAKTRGETPRKATIGARNTQRPPRRGVASHGRPR